MLVLLGQIYKSSRDKRQRNKMPSLKVQVLNVLGPLFSLASLLECRGVVDMWRRRKGGCKNAPSVKKGMDDVGCDRGG